MGELGVAEFYDNVAAIRYLLGVVQRLLCIRKELTHLLFALDKKLSAGIAHTVFIGDLLIRLNAQKHIVCFCISGIRIVTVVGGDHRNVQLPGQLQDAGNHRLLIRISMILQLQKEIPLSENFLVLQCCLFGRFLIPAHEISGHFACKAG